MSVIYDQMTMGHYGSWFIEATGGTRIPLAPNSNPISPNHYTDGIETWDYITSHKMDYIQGNIIKYVTRFRKKNGVEDLKKAKAYLEKLIELESK